MPGRPVTEMRRVNEWDVMEDGDEVQEGDEEEDEERVVMKSFRKISIVLKHFLVNHKELKKNKQIVEHE